MLVEDPRKSSGSALTDIVLILLSTKPEAVLVPIFPITAKIVNLA